MTTGSLVVLLEGGPPASLGTASPTSCNEGSRYIATGGVDGEKGGRTGEGEEDRVRKEERKERGKNIEVYRRRKGGRGGGKEKGERGKGGNKGRMNEGKNRRKGGKGASLLYIN